jgi:hypothetical protein
VGVPDQTPPDPNDSRTWPAWMTRTVIATGIIGAVITVILVRG